MSLATYRAASLPSILFIAAAGCNFELAGARKKPVVPDRQSAPEPEVEEPETPVRAATASTATTPPPAVVAPEPAKPQMEPADRLRFASVCESYEKLASEIESFAYGRNTSVFVNNQPDTQLCRQYCDQLLARIVDVRKLVGERKLPFDAKLDVAGAHLQIMVEFANPKHATLATNQRFDQYTAARKKYKDELHSVQFALDSAASD